MTKEEELKLTDTHDVANQDDSDYQIREGIIIQDSIQYHVWQVGRILDNKFIPEYTAPNLRWVYEYLRNELHYDVNNKHFEVVLNDDD